MLDFKSWQFIRESSTCLVEKHCIAVVHDSMISTYQERLIEAITLTNSKEVTAEAENKCVNLKI